MTDYTLKNKALLAALTKQTELTNGEESLASLMIPIMLDEAEDVEDVLIGLSTHYVAAVHLLASNNTSPENENNLRPLIKSIELEIKRSIDQVSKEIVGNESFVDDVKRHINPK